MAKRNDKEFNQNLTEIQTIIARYIPDIEAQALMIHEINKSINKDDIGRVYLNQYALAMRRKSIIKSFKGTNVKELAEKFDVSEQTIRNDIKEYYQSQIKKSKITGISFIAISKSIRDQK